MLRLLPLILLSFVVFAQNNTRLKELTTKGVALIEQGRFNEAANALEEVWERDTSDPAVAENLAMAYLYADRETSKAKPLALRAIEMGGQASFLVQHPHEKIVLGGDDVTDACSGRLSISRNRAVFTSKDARHSVTFLKGEITEIKSNRVYGSKRGMYHIRTKDKQNFNFRPRSWSEQEQELVLQLVTQYLK